MSRRIEVSFPQFNFVGIAVPFTVASFDRWLDDMSRSSDDAADAVLARNVEQPSFEEVELAKKRFPYLAHRLVDTLCEDAGFAGEGAVLDDALSDDTPPGILGRAGLSADASAELRGRHNGESLRVVIVRDANRQKIFSCVLRPAAEAARLIREARRKKGFGKACRSASLEAIVWSDRKPEDVFDRYPAIPSLVLAEKIAEVAGASAERAFRSR